jgi:hypothetical protein
VRGFSIFVLLTVAAWAGHASAAPAADVVIVWAPGHDVGMIATVAREAGAAVIDRSPAVPKPAEIPAMIARGIQGWDKLGYEAAWNALEDAREAIDRTGGEGVSPAQLSDLFVYRALLRKERGEPTWFDELTAAIVIDPNRAFNAARFPPTLLDDLERARTAIAGRPSATLTVDAPVGCAIAIDGVTSEAGAPRVPGTHWVRVTCPDHAPWGSRVDVGAPSTAVVARPLRLAAPSDADLLIQARTAGATAMIAAEVRGDVGTARLIGLDGRERDRRTVILRGGVGALADAVRELLRPPTRARWYRSRWAWAIGAAVIAAAIVIPITAAATRDSSPTGATIRLPEETW